MAPVIHKAKALAAKAGRHLVVVGFVCGTDWTRKICLNRKPPCETQG